MDNPAAPIPSTFPQSEVSAPVESPNHRWVLWLTGGLILLALGAAIGIFSAKFLNQSQKPSPLTSAPTSVQSPTLTLAPIVSLEPAAEADDPTADWKMYTDDKLGYQLRFPSNWQNLKSKCVSIKINFSKSQETSLDKYLESQGMSGIKIKTKSDAQYIDFPNITLNNVAVLGPLGEGELNEVFIKSASGYFNIIVDYIGPIPDINDVCTKINQYEQIYIYKQILSTFKFLN